MLSVNTEPSPDGGTPKTMFQKHYCSTPIIEKYLHSTTPPHTHRNTPVGRQNWSHASLFVQTSIVHVPFKQF